MRRSSLRLIAASFIIPQLARTAPQYNRLPMTREGLTPEALGRVLEEFLASASAAAVFENGEELFRFSHDASSARYSISGEHGKSLLHLWSSERNAVRRVLDAEIKQDHLLLHVQRFGQAKPSKLEILRDRDQRTPAAKKAARSVYQQGLSRVLERAFPDFSVGRLSSAMDLERSFGPTYARGLLRRGRSAFAVLGVNAQETQASIDAALTFALLWLHACREKESGRLAVEGLKLFVPEGTSAVLRERMACLNQTAAKLELYELEERDRAITQMDCRDRGNIKTHLVRYVDQRATEERFRESIEHIAALLGTNAGRVELVALSPAQLAFRCHGLEFARSRLGQHSGSLKTSPEIVFGAGAHETLLTKDTDALFASMVNRIFGSRHPKADRNNPLWRMQPERWLESLVVRDVGAIDSALDNSSVYSQVPAFSASDRAMIDVLAATRDGRLAVLELKADEDIHLPLQGLDYWARVAWHHARGEFQQFGYFSGRELSAQPPWLILVAPALHLHPATDILLRYLSPEIDWMLAGIDERWREGVRVIFRKRTAARAAGA